MKKATMLKAVEIIQAYFKDQLEAFRPNPNNIQSVDIGHFVKIENVVKALDLIKQAVESGQVPSKE